jgi:glutathione S-transferase
LNWWKQQLHDALLAYDAMLAHNPFLLGPRPYFVDFDLYGVLGNYLSTSKTKLPADLKHLRRWNAAMRRLQAISATRSPCGKSCG